MINQTAEAAQLIHPHSPRTARRPELTLQIQHPEGTMPDHLLLLSVGLVMRFFGEGAGDICNLSNPAGSALLP